MFAFLPDSLSVGLRAAWDQRGRLRELRSRGTQGPIRFEATYVNREQRTLRYVLAIEETGSGGTSRTCRRPPPGGLHPGVPEAGPQERLSRNGDNLPDAVQYLSGWLPDRWSEITRRPAARVPRLSEVTSRVLEDGRMLLRFRDPPFGEPVLAGSASDGTLKVLAYLTVLHDPELSPLIGIEEPERRLRPYPMRGLVEERRDTAASGRGSCPLTVGARGWRGSPR